MFEDEVLEVTYILCPFESNHFGLYRRPWHSSIAIHHTLGQFNVSQQGYDDKLAGPHLATVKIEIAKMTWNALILPRLYICWMSEDDEILPNML